MIREPTHPERPHLPVLADAWVITVASDRHAPAQLPDRREVLCLAGSTRPLWLPRLLPVSRYDANAESLLLRFGHGLAERIRNAKRRRRVPRPRLRSQGDDIRVEFRIGV